MLEIFSTLANMGFSHLVDWRLVLHGHWTGSRVVFKTSLGGL